MLATAMVLSASAMTGCKQKAAQVSSDSTQAAAPSMVATDSIEFNQKSDSTVECRIVVDYPTANDSLSSEVRNFIARELGSLYIPLVNGDEKGYTAYSGKLDNGKALVDFYGKGTVKYLTQQCNEMKSEGADILGMSSEITIRKTDENDRYLTYESFSSSFLGGAHGTTVIYSTNISKITGRTLTQTVDTLKAKALQPLLRKGVVSYLRKQGEKSVNDKNLGEYLFIENGIIPMPATVPYLAKDGVHFVYQQYEIGPYAMGIVEFTVPYAEIKQYLTDDAKKLIE